MVQVDDELHKRVGESVKGPSVPSCDDGHKRCRCMYEGTHMQWSVLTAVLPVPRTSRQGKFFGVRGAIIKKREERRKREEFGAN